MHALTEIALRLGGTDKAQDHAHTEFYGPLLSPRRQSIKNVLEIGISGGGSHAMWAEFFPDANIFGVDINGPSNGEWDRLHANDRIKLFVDNAYTKRFIRRIKRTQFDLIVDDGPHHEKPWRYVLENYVPLLSENGMLVIEDIYTLENAYSLVEGYSGDRDRLSIIDRRPAPSAFAKHVTFTDPRNGATERLWITNEILLMYM